MPAFFRTFLRYAGRLGWFDGRRGYPSQEQYVELTLHCRDVEPAHDERSALASGTADGMSAASVPERAVIQRP